MAYSSQKFLLDDLSKTLFPMQTTKILVESGFDKLKNYGKSIAYDPEEDGNFLPQKRVNGIKKGLHLRRTIKLDPVAEVFLYDLIYRNRNFFKAKKKKNRLNFGYHFSNSTPVSSVAAYKEFKDNISINEMWYEHYASFDVSSYFNHLYHHDLVQWFDERGADEKDVQAFGKFLREINSGRSTDFLPQGIYPAKMIGNDFLKFIESSGQTNCEQILRYMDDIYLFSDDESKIKHDFLLIQELLGLKGLSINTEKTSFDEKPSEEVDEKKIKLLRRRRRVIFVSGIDDEDLWSDDDDVIDQIDSDDVAYLKSLLSEEHIEEDDAELALSVMRDNTEEVYEFLENILKDFPNLSKSFYYFCNHVEDKGFLSELVSNAIKNDVIPEFQLFWLGVIAENHLHGTEKYGEILLSLLNHPSATIISRAKILEIPEKEFGLVEVREEILRSGQSDWLSWAAAVGSLSQKKSARNYALGYFMNGSKMNKVIGEILKGIKD
ncbi:antiviral reverse transcriptase Drt5 [Sneathiella sp. HT1-7]|uniref:antiviral reverse transcriptase Drt5 n=1 Tax=Sneathiella sp. HT1-7 TaxID=2887192 RepID=UPI001D13C684|nr:antiviral reverse transcriptase Drt5 [Sneathiella sp. HT1-7]MCC3305592.1 hypothetical protein [Sneathiella sp. HT1-7]